MIVWCRDLTGGRPLVHDLAGVHQRLPNAEEKVGARGELLLEGDEEAGRWLTVTAATCGVAVATWLVENAPTGLLSGETYERIVRGDWRGVRLTDRHARMLNARRCRRCWPDTPPPATTAR